MHCRRRVTTDSDSVPATPPSSPKASSSATPTKATNNLVTITVSLIDKSVPDFSTQYNSVSSYLYNTTEKSSHLHNTTEKRSHLHSVAV